MAKEAKLRSNDDDDLGKEQVEEEMYEMNAIFSKFKDDPDADCIRVQRLMAVIQAFGRNPSKKDSEERIDELEAMGKYELTLEDVLQILDEPWTVVHNDRDALRQALERFDDQQEGYIDVKQFRTLMSTLGEPLSAHELDELIRLGYNDDRGKIDIDYLLFRLLGDNA